MRKTAVFQQLFRKALASTSIAAVAGMGVYPTPASAEQPSEHKGPTKTPNVLYIVADDLGYSDLSAFGGEISTPNLDSLVASGRILTNFHTSTVSAVTRSMMYSGTDHHLVGEGTMDAPTDERKGLPGYEGYLNDRALCVAQLLRDGGYHTYIAGKWHLGTDLSKGQGPDSWGFERSFVLLWGAANNHFGHEAPGSVNYAADGQYVQPGQPNAGFDWTGFYDTDFYTQQLIKYIDSNKGDGHPFLAFATYTSPHWPLQVPEPYLSKYKGVYDVGYDVIRARRLARQRELGIIPANFTENPGLPNAMTGSPATPNYGTPDARYISAVHNDPSYVDYGPGRPDPTWDNLTDDQKKLFARYMEIYAGMVDNLDHNIGLLIQHLKDIGEYDNTYIVFHSDNGAEGLPMTKGITPITDAFNMQPAVFARLGQSGTWSTYGMRWAEVSATPFKLFKSFTAEGGTSVPAIVHMPGQTERAPDLDTFFHITDSTATILDLAHIAPPSDPAPPLIDPATGINKNAGKVIYDGRYVYPITGLSMVDHLEGRRQNPLHHEPVGEEVYGRASLQRGPWKAVWIDPPYGPADGHWQLYNTQIDRGEVNDVSDQNQDILNLLIGDWNSYMNNVGGVEPLQPKGYY